MKKTKGIEHLHALIDELKFFDKVTGGLMEDKKKKPGKKIKKSGSSSPGKELIRAKAITTSKASRGFSTKKPVKAYLSYPL
jgi:hypothetical protein